MHILNKRFFTIFLVFLGLLIFNLQTVGAAGNFCEPCPCNLGLTCVSGKCQYVCPGGSVCIPNPLKSCSIQDLINNVINFIFYVGLAVAVLMTIIGAFYMVTSGGDPRRVQTAKSIFIYTAVGVLIILLAKAFVSVVKGVLGG